MNKLGLVKSVSQLNGFKSLAYDDQTYTKQKLGLNNTNGSGSSGNRSGFGSNAVSGDAKGPQTNSGSIGAGPTVTSATASFGGITSSKVVSSSGFGVATTQPKTMFGAPAARSSASQSAFGNGNSNGNGHGAFGSNALSGGTRGAQQNSGAFGSGSTGTSAKSSFGGGMNNKIAFGASNSSGFGETATQCKGTFGAPATYAPPFSASFGGVHGNGSGNRAAFGSNAVSDGARGPQQNSSCFRAVTTGASATPSFGGSVSSKVVSSSGFGGTTTQPKSIFGAPVAPSPASPSVFGKSTGNSTAVSPSVPFAGSQHPQTSFGHSASFSSQKPAAGFGTSFKSISASQNQLDGVGAPIPTLGQKNSTGPFAASPSSASFGSVPKPAVTSGPAFVGAPPPNNSGFGCFGAKTYPPGFGGPAQPKTCSRSSQQVESQGFGPNQAKVTVKHDDVPRDATSPVPPSSSKFHVASVIIQPPDSAAVLATPPTIPTIPSEMRRPQSSSSPFPPEKPAQQSNSDINSQPQSAISTEVDADRHLCKICFESELDCALLPCSHMTCYNCATSFNLEKCPFCRKDIAQKIKLFRA